MPRIANRDARAYVQQRRLFVGSNMFSEHRRTQSGTYLYIVFSRKFPMYIAETFDGKTNWYENKDRYSPSTSRHQSQAHPHETTVLYNTEQMCVLALGGITKLVVEGI
jgi:hypothetical protein